MIKLLKGLKITAAVIAILLVIFVIAGLIGASHSVIADNMDMSSTGMDMKGMAMPSSGAISITSLVEPSSNAPVKTFTLTAQMAKIDFGNGKPVDAYTYDGTVPGPELRVQQGDMVIVTLVNHLPFSTSIHWHGVSLPNAEDGVAGLTQDAVKPGATYTYRFLAKDPGTYWYHSHQETSIQLPLGLYGALIVTPKLPASTPISYDRDYTIFLHEWYTSSHEGLNRLTTCHATCPEILTVNDRIDQVSFQAKPGETVRLRIANSGNDVHFPVLVGASYKVIALDGHDLNEPTDLKNNALPVGPAQRYDISFVMPASNSVVLIDRDDRADPAGQYPMAVFGGISKGIVYPPAPTTFDFTTYGKPAPDAITVKSKFTQVVNMDLGEKPGFFNGAFSLVFQINGSSYPNIPAIQVQMGDLVKIHMVGGGLFPFPHAMHLHGHVFTILAHNGVPLSGSPVYLDTVLVNSGETYDVAFLADNPGLWMLHCHMVEHDANGMDMMVVYPGITTPYRIGKTSGNNPF